MAVNLRRDHQTVASIVVVPGLAPQHLYVGAHGGAVGVDVGDGWAPHRVSIVLNALGDRAPHQVPHHRLQERDGLARRRRVVDGGPGILEARLASCRGLWPWRSLRRPAARGQLTARPSAGMARLSEPMSAACNRSRLESVIPSTGASARRPGHLDVGLVDRREPVELEPVVDHGQRRRQLRDRGDRPFVVGVAHVHLPAVLVDHQRRRACTFGRPPRSTATCRSRAGLRQFRPFFFAFPRRERGACHPPAARGRWPSSSRTAQSGERDSGITTSRVIEDKARPRANSPFGSAVRILRGRSRSRSAGFQSRSQRLMRHRLSASIAPGHEEKRDGRTGHSRGDSRRCLKSRP